MKWFTLAPDYAKGDHTFFSRDAGLTSRGFQMLGVESHAMMPGPPMEGDEPDLIRVDWATLESVDYWRRLKLDGVVFFSRGEPRCNAIARAIKDSGAKLVVFMATGGLISPWVEPHNFLYAGYLVWRAGGMKGSQREYPVPVALALTLAHTVYLAFPWTLELPRIRQLERADVIAAVSPKAVERIQKFLRVWRRRETAERVRLVHFPVAPYMLYDGTPKKNQIAAIGRWEDPIKNAPMLIQALTATLAAHKDYSAVIIGSGRERLLQLLQKTPADIAARIRLTGVLPNSELRPLLNESQIILNTSRYEGFNIALAEALCCGCSVAGPNLPTFPSLPFFASRQSGSVAEKYTPDSLAACLLKEVDAWQNQRRSPLTISQEWAASLHAPAVARTILNFFTASS